MGGPTKRTQQSKRGLNFEGPSRESAFLIESRFGPDPRCLTDADTPIWIR
jgi:hypothetical protein